MIRDNYVHEQGTAAAVALHPCHQVGFSPSCWGPCPAVCPFYQNSPVFSVREETEMLCSNPADCCAAFCSRAPVCPLPNDWAKDNTATRTTVSLCPANELRDAWLPQEQPKGTECPEPALLTGRQLEKSGKKTKPEALSTLIPKLWDFIVLLDRSNENKYEVAHLKSETIPFLYIVWMYLKYGFCLGANVPSSYGNRKIREQSSAGKGKKAGTGVHVCTHTKTQAHTRTQLIEGDSHFSRGDFMLNYIYSEVSVHLSSLFTFKMNAIWLICPEEKLLHSNMTY